MPSDSNTRVRTSNFLSARNLKLTTKNGVLFNVYKYTINGDFINNEAVYRVDNFVINDFSKCYKMSFQKGEGTDNIKVEEVLSSLIIEYDVNDKIKHITLSDISLEQGSIQFDTGKEINSQTRVRTTNFITNKNFSLSTNEGILMNIYRYEPDGKFVRGISYKGNKFDFIDDIYLYRISFQKGEKGTENISIDDVILYFTEIVEYEKTIKALHIGNSFTEDSMGYVPFLLKEICPNVNFKIGIAIKGACKLAETAAALTGESQILNGETIEPVDYVFSVSEKGDPWNLLGSKNIDTIINYEEWDIITVQQNGANAFSDFDTYFKPFLPKIVNAIFNKINNPIKLGFILTHGSYGGTDSEVLKEHWKGTANNVKKVIDSYPFNIVFPYGTAVENIRTTSISSLGDTGNLLADNTHLQDGIGCLTAAYANILVFLKLAGYNDIGVLGEKTIRPTKKWLTEKNIRGTNLGTSDTVIGITEANCRIAQISAIQAVKHPYDITDISMFE